MLSMIVLAVSISSVLSGAVVNKPVPDNNFAASCSVTGFSNNVLSAVCTDDGGQARGTSINVNNCVTNNNGGLACEVK